MKITGLTDAQVQEMKAKFGDNSITEQAREGFWDKLKGNFDDPIIKILIFALVLNVFFAFMGKAEWYESVGIAMAVLLATLVSTFSEYKNESAFQKLQGEASLIKCKVYRNGVVTEIPINDITMGDCVLLQTGDKIPADGVIIDGSINVGRKRLKLPRRMKLRTLKPRRVRIFSTRTKFFARRLLRAVLPLCALSRSATTRFTEKSPVNCRLTKTATLR